jgi:uncharacterized protein (DUF2249 family)/16S rRNA G966 N2-methylase RsmD
MSISKEDKNNYGIVYTPNSLVDKILDLIPLEHYKNPTLKWLDIGAGNGAFSLNMYNRLMNTLSTTIPNNEARKAHILENMIYMCEIYIPHINKLETLFSHKTNIIKTDFLMLNANETLNANEILNNTQKFNIIIGNPPYNINGALKTPTNNSIKKTEDGKQVYVPLNAISENQGKFHIYNSLLSEYAALGFEYGYSTTTPKDLTLWEAQFGDFSNGAQIIIDQFIASAEAKWSKFSGLTLLLPHGSEGQGPEHSSARPERFLQLCAGSNMQVLNCTTPANLFHALRRQLKRNFSMPLVVMTPKSLLRHPKCVSMLTELSEGSFEELILDSIVPKNARKVLLCSGKVYYDLLDYRETNNITDVALVRIEQLYPLPEWLLADVFKQYEGATFAWVQEEPMNQGAWLHLFRYEFPVKLEYYGRKSSASPATGFKKVHDREQAEIVTNAFS